MAGLQESPSAERVHIGFFGRRNAGKSSLVNAVTGQALCLVSDTPGTTTDPVAKAMELLPLGPVVVVDTPGLDDEGDLGALRVKRAKEELERMDLGVVVLGADQSMGDVEAAVLRELGERKIPSVVVRTKVDLFPDVKDPVEGEQRTSAVTGAGIEELRERMAQLALPKLVERKFVGDLVKEGDFVVLVAPIDASAPKGRIILPQQMAIRDLLDAKARVLVTQPEGLAGAIEGLKQKPALVITDSQAFAPVAKDTPQDIPLTSFSILMARYKGYLEGAVRGLAAVARLKDGDRILMAEGCTHRRQCGDIGTVKIPGWLLKSSGLKLSFEHFAGQDFPQDCTPYALAVNCGGCMLTPRNIAARIDRLERQQVPYTNYGVLIAYMKGVLARSLAPFPHLLELLPKKG